MDELSSGLDEDDDEESEEALTARNVFEDASNGTTIHSSIPKDEKVGFEENSWKTSPQGARGRAAATSSPGSAAGQPEVSAFQQRSSPIL